MTTGEGAGLVVEMRAKTKELAEMLDEFSGRLRRMRERNRSVEQEIISFERDLDRLRQWLSDAT